MMPFDLTELRAWLPEDLLFAIAPVQDCYAQLLPQEQAVVERAVSSRRCEFSSARSLAHTLLAKLGQERMPLLPLPDRSPAWPPGILGSLSHSRHWCAAALARNNGKLFGVGVDIEDSRPLKSGLFPEILTPNEIQALSTQLAPQDRSARALTAFSIKEAVFKCLYARGNRNLGFLSMEIDFEAATNRPRVVPMQELQERLPHGARLQAYGLQQGEVILSVVTLA
jgi:4'-phosphopantetheinyl transferase EntD